jgi:hypothetical protein
VAKVIKGGAMKDKAASSARSIASWTRFVKSNPIIEKTVIASVVDLKPEI